MKIHQRKSLGQVFLTRDEPALKTIELLQARKVTDVVEIGPGSGALTKHLIAAGFGVTCVEKDARFAALLSEKFPSQDLRIVQDDFLNCDLSDLMQAGIKHSTRPVGMVRVAVVGNIPYYISSAIVQKCLEKINEVGLVILLTQKEFAERCFASPGGKNFGSLSVFCQLRATCTNLLSVPRTWFEPIPKVDSVLWSMEALSDIDQIPEQDLHAVEKMTLHCFHQRRKKISNSLKPFISGMSEEDLRSIQAAVDFTFDMRPEQLSPRQFYRLTQEINLRRKRLSLK